MEARPLRSIHQPLWLAAIFVPLLLVPPLPARPVGKQPAPHGHTAPARHRSGASRHMVPQHRGKQAAIGRSQPPAAGAHGGQGHHAGNARAESANTYTPPLILHTPSPTTQPGAAAPLTLVPPSATGEAPQKRTSAQESTAANSLPQDSNAEPILIDQGAVHTVGQQLAQGGTALQFPSALRHFFDALHQREVEPGNGTVRVLQFGDSHTAADMFTGEARARMQARFGDGGVGFSYAGHPFAGYRILGSGRGQSGSWQTLGTHFTQLGDGQLGLGGVAIQSSRPGDTVSLDAPCLTLQVQYLRQPGGGSFQLSDNGAAVGTVSTATIAPEPEVNGAAGSTDADPAQSLSLPGSSLPASAPTPTDSAYSARASRNARFGYAATSSATTTPAPQGDAAPAPPATPPAVRGAVQSPMSSKSAAGTLRYDCAAGSHHFTLTSQGGGPVRLLGTVALQPGITWESIGINGAEAPLLLRWNQGIFRAYLAAASPDLIVLAYGTNEAAARWSGEDYGATFARLIDTLHRTTPAASILVVGPADRSLGSTTYTVSGRGRRARRIAHRFYAPYGGTARILNAQRDICSTHDCAFWDWQARQGGFGAMNRWAAAGYAQPDHTHFTGTGYHALADALVADLLRAYSGYAPALQ